MSKILTLFVLALMSMPDYLKAQCSVGDDNIVSYTAITVNGNMSDWAPILNDGDNTTYDANPDGDAPISDVGRDFTRFAFTEDISKLYLYFQRAGSVNNSVDLLFYLDVNNNGLMQTNEPVVAISWGGSNGNTQVDIYNYTQVAAGGDPIVSDGIDMPGSLSLRIRLGNLGKGSTDGVSLEVGVPFTQLYRMGSVTNADSLAPIEQFKFHVSSINGSVASVPGSNSVNDNFGGCFSGFMMLPVMLVYLEAETVKSSALLKWKIADNENAQTFEIEQSRDGYEYYKAGTVYATDKAGNEIYSFQATLNDNRNFFRLKIVDKHQLTQHSKIVTVSGNATTSTGTLKVNNPVAGDLVMRYEAKAYGPARVTLYNLSGAVIYSKNEMLSKGVNTLTVNSNILKEKGAYVVELKNHLNEKAVQKVLKL